jgi:hypothetical protein
MLTVMLGFFGVCSRHEDGGVGEVHQGEGRSRFRQGPFKLFFFSLLIRGDVLT